MIIIDPMLHIKISVKHLHKKLHIYLQMPILRAYFYLHKKGVKFDVMALLKNMTI